jgi:hypothetical protein
MVRLDVCIDGMGWFSNSNMTHTNNLTIKQQTYRIINVNGANVEIFSMCACMDGNLKVFQFVLIWTAI